VLLAEATETGIAERITERLGRWHLDHPDLPGPAKAALLGGLAMLPAEVTEAVLRGLIAQDVVVSRGRALALPGHRPRLAPADEAAWGQIEPLLRAPDLRPPRVRELAIPLGLDPAAAEALLLRLERFGLVLRVAPNRFFLPETTTALGAIAETMAREAEADGADGFTAGAYSQRSGIGRNLTIQVLEFLDRAGLTRRNGEFRHLNRTVTEVFG
jgi:selenocysteine-specific elongation factor